MKFDDLLDETCGWCGKPYDGTRVDQKFCSPACQRKSSKAFDAAVISEERRIARKGKICPNCGVAFDAPLKAYQKYCSIACGKAGWNYHARDKPRAERRSQIRCISCGGEIPDAKTINRRMCTPCKRDRQKEYYRKRKDCAAGARK